MRLWPPFRYPTLKFFDGFGLTCLYLNICLLIVSMEINVDRMNANIRCKESLYFNYAASNKSEILLNFESFYCDSQWIKACSSIRAIFYCLFIYLLLRNFLWSKKSLWDSFVVEKYNQKNASDSWIYGKFSQRNKACPRTKYWIN